MSILTGPVGVTVMVTTNRAPTLGNIYVLTCDVSGAENLSPATTYQWSRDSGTGTQTQVGKSRTLSFSPLSLSDAGQYSCSVTVNSPYLNSDIMASSLNYHTLMLQGELT